MNIDFRQISVVFSLALLVGCASIKYNFNNESYRSSDDAVAAQKAFLDKMLGELKVREKSIDAKVLVITPNKTTIEALGITRTGTPKQEIIDYVTQTSQANQRFNFQALQASKLFSQTEYRVAEHTLKDARQEVDNYSAIVYLHLVSPTQSGWYMLKRENDKPIQINVDALSKGTQKIESWIDSVELAYKNR